MALRNLACLAVGLLVAHGVGAVTASDPSSDEVALLQVALSAASPAKRGRNGTISSFIANDGFHCAEGPSRLAEAALATFKAGPIGLLFNASFARPGESCASRGYKLAEGEDECFPGLKTFSQVAGQKVIMSIMVLQATFAYGATYGLDNATLKLMTQCTCHPQSQTAKGAGTACSSLANVTGSWVQRDPGDGKELICAQGPYLVAARSLATVKASKKLAMHPEQVSPRSCSSRGFSVECLFEDGCYPPMKGWTRTFFLMDAGLGQSVLAEHSPAMERFSLQHGLDAQVFGTDTNCNCLAGSKMGRENAAACSQQGTAGRSPVLDFWDGSQ